MKDLIRRILREQIMINEFARGSKSNTDEFIENAKKVHGDKYTYDNVVYGKNGKELVNITCKIHGDFPQQPNNHLSGHGCSKCANEEKRKKLENFIQDAKKVHGDKYTYDNVVYKIGKENVFITCEKHGDFPQPPSTHLRGHGCPTCYFETLSLNTDEFIEKAKKVHGNKYTYDNVVYGKNGKELVNITCKIHGDFPQPPEVHLQGHGCPTCSESKGELIISKLLNTLEIQFVREKKFEDCKGIGKYCRQLKFDFYLPEFNAVIEYDGRQHFKPIKGRGGEETFKKIQINDEIKNKYCKDNGIKMIRIPYTIKFDDILSLLKNELGITG